MLTPSAGDSCRTGSAAGLVGTPGGEGQRSWKAEPGLDGADLPGLINKVLKNVAVSPSSLFVKSTLYLYLSRFWNMAAVGGWKWACLVGEIGCHHAVC